MTLDPKGLTAAATAMRAECPCIPVMDISEPFLEMMLDKAITAYLSAVPSDVAGLVERSKGEWRYDIQYGPEGEANYAWVYSGKGMVATCKTHHAIAIVNAMNDATALSALSARPSVNETLERAAKKLEEMKRLLMSQTVVLDVTADCAVYDLAAAAIRKMKEPG